MRNAIIGIVIGIVVGVVAGATVVAPRLTQDATRNAAVPLKTLAALPVNKAPPTPAKRKVEEEAEKVPERDKRHPPFPEQVDLPIAPLPPKADPKDTDNPAEKAEEKENENGAGPPAGPSAGKTAAEKPTGAPPPKEGSETKVQVDSQVDSQADSDIQEVAAVPSPPPVKASPPPPPADPPATRWKMGSAYSGNLPQLGTMAKKLERDIWRVSDGTLEIKFYEPGALVPPLEMFDAVRAGVIDAAFSSPGFWGNKAPALQLFAAVPFGPTAKEYLAWIYFGGGKELFDEIYHDNGIHSVFCGLIAPEASGWFRKRIRTVEDLKGLKMRIFGLGAKVMQKLGVTTTQLTSGDIFVAFESGAIDAAEFSMPAIDLKLGFHRMAKNYYFPGWHQPSTLFELMINLEKWTALSASAKAQIEAVCGDNIRFGLAEGEAAQYAALKELQTKGVVIRRWPGEILEALNKAWNEVAKEEAKANRDFKRVWKSLSAFREDYTIWQELSLAE